MTTLSEQGSSLVWRTNVKKYKNKEKEKNKSVQLQLSL